MCCGAFIFRDELHWKRHAWILQISNGIYSFGVFRLWSMHLFANNVRSEVRYHSFDFRLKASALIILYINNQKHSHAFQTSSRTGNLYGDLLPQFFGTAAYLGRQLQPYWRWVWLEEQLCRGKKFCKISIRFKASTVSQFFRVPLKKSKCLTHKL